MATVLVTHNGRFGDLLWQLPLIRAISRRLQAPVDLMIPGEFRSIVPLLQQQDYLGTVRYDANWAQSERAYPFGRNVGPIALVDLGYRGWPEPDVLRHTLVTANAYGWSFSWEDLDLATPWITVSGPAPPTELAIGFTEAWFELKLGLMTILDREGLPPYTLLSPQGSRWWTETPPGTLSIADSTDWVANAGMIRNADRFFGDCSALHVLAVALGTPVLLMEPMEQRHNPVFYPLGWDGPQVRIVKGNGGKPTFDARATLAALKES